MVRQRYPLILSEDNDDQKLRESDGPKRHTYHTQPRAVVLNANFP